MKDTKSVWWAQLVFGILTLLLGWVLLARPISTIVSLVGFLGFYLFISGIFKVVMSLFGIGEKDSGWGWELLSGVLAIIAGLVVLNNALFASIFTPTMFAYFVAFAILFEGGVRMFAGKRDAASGNYIWTWGGLVLGLLYFLFGIYLLAAPTIYTVSTIVVASGWFAIFVGTLGIVYSFIDRSESKKVTA